MEGKPNPNNWTLHDLLTPTRAPPCGGGHGSASRDMVKGNFKQLQDIGRISCATLKGNNRRLCSLDAPVDNQKKIINNY